METQGKQQNFSSGKKWLAGILAGGVVLTGCASADTTPRSTCFSGETPAKALTEANVRTSPIFPEAHGDDSDNVVTTLQPGEQVCVIDVVRGDAPTYVGTDGKMHRESDKWDKIATEGTHELVVNQSNLGRQ